MKKSKRKSTTSSKKLLQKQKELLGFNYSKQIFSSELSVFHIPPGEDSFYEDEEEQSYDTFVEMGVREPNTEGTGRYLLTPQRNRIGKNNKSSPILKQKQKLQEYISAFIGLQTDIIDHDAKNFNLKDGTLHVGDYIYELDLFPKVKVGTKRKAKEEVSVEVFSLFDALESIVVEPYMSIVAFFDSSLCEEIVEEEEASNSLGYQIVYGRACGNRIACVSLKDCETFKDLLCVTLHEMLHTIGFDHCNSWQCLMNATGSDSWIFLSPVNLRKLLHFHQQELNDQFLIDRYQQLLMILRGWEDPHFTSEIDWLSRKIEVLREILPKEIIT